MAPYVLNRLVLCTGNAGKVVELKALLPSSIEVLSLKDIGAPQELPETGATFLDNALEKARSCYLLCGLPCVADDSGLEVIALDGAPGVYSAHYAGPEKDPIANMDRLLTELRGRKDREARFRTVIALVGPEGERTFDGVVNGMIVDAPRGEGGFGYDPIFLPDGSDRTFAEMDKTAKNAISHRGSAIRKLVTYLASA